MRKLGDNKFAGERTNCVSDLKGNKRCLGTSFMSKA